MVGCISAERVTESIAIANDCSQHVCLGHHGLDIHVQRCLQLVPGASRFAVGVDHADDRVFVGRDAHGELLVLARSGTGKADDAELGAKHHDNKWVQGAVQKNRISADSKNATVS